MTWEYKTLSNPIACAECGVLMPVADFEKYFGDYSVQYDRRLLECGLCATGTDAEQRWFYDRKVP